MDNTFSKRTILIADDEEMNLDLLSNVFRDDFNIITVVNGKEAIEAVVEHKNSICCILLDLMMPVISGYQVLQHLGKTSLISSIPVVLISGVNDQQSELRCYQLGAQAFIGKPFNPEKVKVQVENIIKTYDELNRKIRTIEEQNRIIEKYNSRMLEMVANLIEERNGESGSHVKRVKTLTFMLAMTYLRLFPESGLTENRVKLIAEASMLHDLGKIRIPDNILLKAGPLTPEERAIMETHCQLGVESMQHFFGSLQSEEQLALTMEICQNHHERYDGKGYPRHLQDEQIPFSAKVVSVADCFDALVTDRCYRKGFSCADAYAMVMAGKCGGSFDPKVLQCLTAGLQEIEGFYNALRQYTT